MERQQEAASENATSPGCQGHGTGPGVPPSQYTKQSSHSWGSVIGPAYYLIQSLYRNERVMDTTDRILHVRQETTLVVTVIAVVKF